MKDFKKADLIREELRSHRIEPDKVPSLSPRISPISPLYLPNSNPNPNPSPNPNQVRPEELEPGDPLHGLAGADAALTFYTDRLAPVTTHA